jgi:hypothetical protein
MGRYFIVVGMILVLFIVGCSEDKGTKPNNLPYAPSSPSPPSGAADQPTNTKLSWSGGDPDGDPVTYDLYLGTVTPPPIEATGLTQTIYDPGLLNENTTYYWEVVSNDNRGGEAPGTVWTFTTGTGTGYANIVQVESVYVSSGSEAVVSVFAENNKKLSAITVPLSYSSTALVCDSVSFIGSRIDYLSMKGSNIDISNRLVLAWGLIMDDSLIPTGSGLLCNIHFTITYPVNTVVTIDSALFPPANNLVYVDSLSQPITPQFVPGKIVINTQ